MKITPEHLAAIKASRRMTYSQLGDLMGVSAATAQNYVLGRTTIPDDHADRVLSAIGEPPTLYRKGAPAAQQIPYFDVDVMATPIEVFSDQTVRPAYMIDMPGFSDCDFAINVYGHSMYPTIESGMIVLCKKVNDIGILMYGEIYFIVTDDFRMVKRLIKSDKPGYIIAASDNHNGHSSPDGKTYAPIEIQLEKIRHLYAVKGIFKRCLI